MCAFVRHAGQHSTCTVPGQVPYLNFCSRHPIAISGIGAYLYPTGHNGDWSILELDSQRDTCQQESYVASCGEAEASDWKLCSDPSRRVSQLDTSCVRTLASCGARLSPGWGTPSWFVQHWQGYVARTSSFGSQRAGNGGDCAQRYGAPSSFQGALRNV